MVARHAYNNGSVPPGLYISIPFCRTKCSYCNFASDVFSKSAYENYVRRVIEDIAGSRATSDAAGGRFEEQADSIYLGGGTPSILESSQLVRIFRALRERFSVTPDAEITVECAPGTLTDSLIEDLSQIGVNRVSLGVQSFVDREAQSVGRLHKRSTVIEEVARLRKNGIQNINIDLIAGLPHQTSESWSFSLDELISLGVPHASVYMLEVDDDSRLGRELIAGGARYHAHFVPDDAAMADFYTEACERLNAAGVEQYEISNFARAGGPVVTSEPPCSRARGWESRHNLKYWTRQPYLGFGVDAHSMLRAVPNDSGWNAVRFATADSLDSYMNRAAPSITRVSPRAGLEESFFLGLRLNRGIDPEALRGEFDIDFSPYESVIDECRQEGLLEAQAGKVKLTARGRLFSNEVFERFLLDGREVRAAD